MKEELVFQERQRFSQWWIILIILFSIIFTPFIQLITGKPIEYNDPMFVTMLIILTVLAILLAVGFYFLRLDTIINEEGVYERMFPFQLKFGFTPWGSILDANVVKKKFNRKYQKWKFRIGFREKSFTTSGNYELKLTLKNNKRIFIGTQIPEELAEFLDKLNAERKQE